MVAGLMDVFGAAAFVAGTAAYNRYLSRWSYRRILSAVQLILTAVNLLDYVWVSRWNLELGIPDAYFAMGYEVLQPFAKRANLLPIFILAAKLCPRRAQAAASMIYYMRQCSLRISMVALTSVHLSQPWSHQVHMHMQTRLRPCSEGSAAASTVAP